MVTVSGNFLLLHMYLVVTVRMFRLLAAQHKIEISNKGPGAVQEELFMSPGCSRGNSATSLCSRYGSIHFAGTRRSGQELDSSRICIPGRLTYCNLLQLQAEKQSPTAGIEGETSPSPSPLSPLPISAFPNGNPRYLRRTQVYY